MRLLLSLLLLCTCLPILAQDGKKRPNIVLLFADDLGRYASAYSHPEIPSVNDIVSKTLGGDLCPYIHTVFSRVDGKDVAMVIVSPAPRAVYLEENKASVFYLRSGNSTRALDVREAVNYANKRWS